MKDYHHLTRDQRCQIYALKKRGFSQTQIAADLGVSQGTISRELRRNKGLRGYRFKQAGDEIPREKAFEHARSPYLLPFLYGVTDMLYWKIMNF